MNVKPGNNLCTDDKGLIMKRGADQIKSEVFIDPDVKKIKTEPGMCSNNEEINSNPEVEEKTLNAGQFLSENPDMKDAKNHQDGDFPTVRFPRDEDQNAQLERADAGSDVPRENSRYPAQEPSFPDYFWEYGTIFSAEQCRKYKADFNDVYHEYRDLHTAVHEVRSHFGMLEEKLKQQERNSPAYKSVLLQIGREYQESRHNIQYQKAKERFLYLHHKLSHIKRLVLEYNMRAVQQSNHI